MATFKIRASRGFGCFSIGIDNTTHNPFNPLAFLRASDSRVFDIATPGFASALYDTTAVNTTGTITVRPTVTLPFFNYLAGPNTVPLANTVGIQVGDIVSSAGNTFGSITSLVPNVSVDVTVFAPISVIAYINQGAANGFTSVGNVYNGVYIGLPGSFAQPGSTLIEGQAISNFTITAPFIYLTNAVTWIIPGTQGTPVTLSCRFFDLNRQAGTTLSGRDLNVDSIPSHGGLILLGPNGLIPFTVRRAIHRLSWAASAKVDTASGLGTTDIMSSGIGKWYGGVNDPTTNPGMFDERYFLQKPAFMSKYYEGDTLIDSNIPLESNAALSLNGTLSADQTTVSVERVGNVGPTATGAYFPAPSGYINNPTWSQTFVETTPPTGNVATPSQVTRIMGYSQIPIDTDEIRNYFSAGDAAPTAFINTEYEIDVDDVILTSINSIQGKVLAMIGISTGDLYFQGAVGGTPTVESDVIADFSLIRAVQANTYLFCDLNFTSGANYLNAFSSAVLDTFIGFVTPVAAANPVTEYANLSARAIGSNSSMYQVIQ